MQISCPPENPSSDLGSTYNALGWALQGVATFVIAIRLYSRIVLTRSAGSDDVAIVLGLTFCGIGNCIESVAVHYGLGRHCSAIPYEQLQHAIKWIYIEWIVAFFSLFFIRTSIMLFTLRLMPRVKTKSQLVVYVVFFLNFAITITSVVTFSVYCRPFSALWNPQPGSKCLSRSYLSATQQANGILSCIIDIATALVPAFLLWKVKMKPRTKLILDIIFGLGVVTAGLSIGRAVTSPVSVFSDDITWRIVASKFITEIETKIGIILACGPSLRQLNAYHRRTGTWLPSEKRQAPNADFQTFRHRVNYRDFFWRGKQDPVRAQGISNSDRRWLGSQSERNLSDTTTSRHANDIGVRKDIHVDPEDSPLDYMKARAVHIVKA